MKTIPILFSTEMVQALMEGRKTQTRRAVRADLSDCYYQSLVNHATGWFSFVPNGNYNPTEKEIIEVKCPYGQPGDVLWVRESWALSTKEGVTPSEKSTAIPWYYNPEHFDVVYKASSGEDFHPEHPEWGKKRWKPSIHMPKTAARLFLKITDVRVERLQDISEEDIISEGVQIPCVEGRPVVALGEKNGAIDFLPDGCFAEGRQGPSPYEFRFAYWAELWCKVNGRESWDANPWVWVVTFERCEKPENF